MKQLRLILCLLAFGICANAYSALDPEQKRVFEELKSKAAAGDSESQYWMGKWYLVGHEPGMPKTDKKMAEFWLQKAAEKGYKPAFNDLSAMYYDKFAYSKERNPDDLAEACKWRFLEINNDEFIRTLKFFNIFPLSEKTRADGEARAKKFRADHLGKTPAPSRK